MKRSIILFAVIVSLAGCRREPQEVEEKETAKPAPAPAVAEEPKPAPAVAEEPKPAPAVAEEPKPATVVPDEPGPEPLVPPVAPAEAEPQRVPPPQNAAARPSVLDLLGLPGTQLQSLNAGEAVSQARDLVMNGQTDEAIQALTRAFNDPSCQPDRPLLASALLEVTLNADRLRDAKALATELLKDQNTDAFVTMINEHLLRQKDFAGVVEWTAQIGPELPPEGPLATENYLYRIAALVEVGRLEDAAQSVSSFLDGDKESLNVGWLSGVVGNMIAWGDLDTANHLLNAFSEQAEKNPSYAGMISELQTRLYRERTGLHR